MNFPSTSVDFEGLQPPPLSHTPLDYLLPPTMTPDEQAFLADVATVFRLNILMFIFTLLFYGMCPFGEAKTY